MRLTAGNAVLLLLLGGLVVLDVAVRPAPLADLVQAPLFPGLRTSDVALLAIEDPAQGAAGRVALRRAAGGWEVEQRHGFPAESALVEELLAGLAALTTADRAATVAASHALLGVGTTGLRVRLSSSGGAVLADLVLGVPPADEPAAAVVHVRRAEDVSVLRAPGLALPAADPAAWLRTRVLSVELGAAARLDARWSAADGSARALALELAGGAWRRAGSGGEAGTSASVVPTARVRALLDAAGMLHVRDVVAEAGRGGATGIDPGREVLVLSLMPAGGETLTLRIGDPLDAESVAVTSSAWSRPWVGALPERSAELLLDALEELWRTLE